MKEVITEMLCEEEDGTTPIHIMLDGVISNAINNGANGVKLIGE